MNDDRSGSEPPDSEAETIKPDKELGWQMPQPKFRQTSGYLPQGYIDKAGMSGTAAGSAAAPAPTAEAPPQAAELDVVPQPDLSEQIETPPVSTVVPGKAAPARSTGARVAMLLLGLLGMVIFIVIFLGVIWYLFLRPADGGSPF